MTAIKDSRPLRFDRTVIAEGNATIGGVGPGNVTVYRVEGSTNTHVIIGQSGEVAITVEEGKDLYLNFGSRMRAESFFARRVRQNWPGVQMKAFEVPKSFVDDLRMSSVPEGLAKKYPDSPLRVDITKAPDQYGLRPPQIEKLKKEILQGTGRVIKKGN